MTSAHSAVSAPPAGPWMRYRARYAKLPPPVQMIGLQLWLPLVFVIAFCLCYLAAFHHPNPQDIKVAVVGTSSQSQQLGQGLESSTKGLLKVSGRSSVAVAEHDVRDSKLAAAFTPGTQGTPAHLIVASADSFQLAAVVKETFQGVAASEGTTLQVQDVAPLPTRDSYGTSAFYLTLVWTIAGYMVAMFVGMMGAPLKHRVRLGIIAGSGFVFSLLATVLATFVVGAFTGSHFFELWMIGWATTFAVGVVVNGLAYFLGRFVTGAALIIFVFLNIPSSGGAYPSTFVPEPFKSLGHVVSASGTLALVRDVAYKTGPGAGFGLLVLGCYAAVGLILSALGKPYAARRALYRAKHNKPLPMMLAAQAAAVAAQQAQQAQAADSGPGRHSADGGVNGSGPDGTPLSDEEARRRIEQEQELAENEYAGDEADADAAASASA